jgi:hypothetical protein
MRLEPFQTDNSGGFFPLRVNICADIRLRGTEAFQSRALAAATCRRSSHIEILYSRPSDIRSIRMGSRKTKGSRSLLT